MDPARIRKAMHHFSPTKGKMYQNHFGHGSLDTSRLRRDTREPSGAISDNYSLFLVMRQ